MNSTTTNKQLRNKFLMLQIKKNHKVKRYNKVMRDACFDNLPSNELTTPTEVCHLGMVVGLMHR